MTGLLWQSCEPYCQGCKNAATGHCVLIGNAPCDGKQIEAYQCQCSGTWSGENKPWCFPGGLGK